MSSSIDAEETAFRGLMIELEAYSHENGRMESNEMRGKEGRKQGRNMRKWGGSKVGYKARKREVKMRAELNSMRDTCMAIEGKRGDEEAGFF